MIADWSPRPLKSSAEKGGYFNFHCYDYLKRKLGFYGEEEEWEADFDFFDGENNEEEPPKPIEESFRTDTCIICLDKEPNILFTDCNHICICLECVKIKSLDNCPYCRTEISKRIKIQRYIMGL